MLHCPIEGSHCGTLHTLEKKKKNPVKEGRWIDLTPTYTTSKE